MGFYNDNIDLIIGFMSLLALNLIFPFLFIRDCNDMGCLGLALIPLIGVVMSGISAIMVIIKNIRKKKFNTSLRWILCLILIVLIGIAIKTSNIWSPR